MEPAGRRPVVDVAYQAPLILAPARRRKALGRLRLTDASFHHLTRAAAIAVLVILGGVILALIDGALPALRAFGVNFLFEERWNPVTERFGALYRKRYGPESTFGEAGI